MPKKGHIVIVGFGWVGQANALSLSLMGYDVAYFDPGSPTHHYTQSYNSAYKNLARLSDVLEVDSAATVYIVCVGDRVSEDGEQDISSIEKALDSLRSAQGTVVLRSTIVPDKLDSLNFDYYVPEFLHEKKAVEESLSPHFFVSGKKEGTTRREPAFFAEWRRRTPKQFDGTPREAAFVKYLSNLWNAARIAFVNEFGDAMADPASPAEVDSISRVINFVLAQENYTRYGRSFGGHCLPKDTRAFSKWYGEQGRGVSFVKGIYSSNEAHKKVEERYTALPEWFSEWETPHMSGFVAWRELWYSVLKNFADPREFMRRYWRPFLVVVILVLLTDIILLAIK